MREWKWCQGHQRCAVAKWIEAASRGLGRDLSMLPGRFPLLNDLPVLPVVAPGVGGYPLTVVGSRIEWLFR